MKCPVLTKVCHWTNSWLSWIHVFASSSLTAVLLLFSYNPRTPPPNYVFPGGSRKTFLMRFSFPSWAPHDLTILIHSPKQYFARSSNYEAPDYVFSLLLFLLFSICSPTLLICVIPYAWETRFHTHIMSVQVLYSGPPRKNVVAEHRVSRSLIQWGVTYKCASLTRGRTFIHGCSICLGFQLTTRLDSGCTWLPSDCIHVLSIP